MQFNTFDRFLYAIGLIRADKFDELVLDSDFKDKRIESLLKVNKRLSDKLKEINEQKV